MIKFKESSTGNSYINFQSGRVFIKKDENYVTLKAYRTWQGRHYKPCHWICLSIKSQKPIIYRFVPRQGIQNITYQTTLLKEIDYLLDRVSSDKDRERRNIIKQNFFAFCYQLLGERCNRKTLNANILRAWMPLLNHYNDEDVLKLIPVLKHPLVREGFKQGYLKDCINLWFGHSPKGLTRRIANMLEQKNFAQLPLALSCRGWNLDHLYSLLDSEFFWDSSIDIKKASLLLTAYPEKKWLGLLKTFNLSSSKNKLKSKIYELEDTIQMFVDSRNSDYSLPLRPKSIREIHNDLVKESRRQKNLELNNRVLPQKLSDLDNIKAGEMKIVTPKIGEDLIVWGKELNNCLMSYIERVIHTKYSVIGILKEDKIKYALGIFDREIQQFSGINNSSPLAQDEKMIRETLLKYNVL